MGLDLLSGSGRLYECIADASKWAEEFSFCTSALGVSGSRSSLWQALRPQLGKLSRAYVALEALRTKPDALLELHGLGKLRLIPAVDGSFRANLWTFSRGKEQIVVVGSGALLPPALMAPHEAYVRWSGFSSDHFAEQAEAFFEKIRKNAHVPTQEELTQYRDAFADAEELHEHLLELGGDFHRPTTLDADLPELSSVVDRMELRRAHSMIVRHFEEQATFQTEHRLGFQGGSIEAKLHWISSMMIWGAFHTTRDGYENRFGVTRPAEDGSLEITVAVNLPREGVNRRLGGALGRDPRSGALYLLHSGRIGGGRKGVGAEQFWRNFRSSALLKDHPSEEPRRVAVVGRLDSSDFVREASSFVHEVARIKRAAR
ncbi:MAG: hypothetical protein MUF64_15755 [Polyangiaceae bacterium]|jgi:hypothetical protein|nr:hypothetical protein [Polyangiaceae bacterium]